jgi:sec-independent protein translocase protein TatB
MGDLPPISEANISMGDSLMLMILALVVFGPRRLPQIGRQIGKLMYEFRKASNDFKFQMEEELRNAEEADRRKREEAERQKRLGPGAQTQPAEMAAGAQSPQGEGAAPDSAASAVTEAAPETPSEESVPRILPPATGQTVAAGRPARSAAQDAGNGAGRAGDAQEAGRAGDGQEKEAAEGESGNEPGAVTEQASRNG